MEMKVTKENWAEVIRLRRKAYENAKGRFPNAAKYHKARLEELVAKKGHLA